MKTHPLHHLAKIRQENAESAAKKLSDSVATAALAFRRLHASEQARAEVVQQNQHVETATHASLQQGELRAADLAQQAAWRVGAEGRRQQADEAVTQNQSVARRAEETTHQARAETAQAKADADVVETLLERDRTRRLAREQAAQEEAAEEGFLSRYGRSK